MDEKQILKEIAYYSRIINQHKKWNQNTHYSNSYSTNKITRTPSYDMTKYKYVKKPQPTVITPVIEAKTSSKVIINPNFKGCVHINPHFKAAQVPVNTQKIHVNPKILNTTSVNFLKPTVQVKPPSQIPAVASTSISYTMPTTSHISENFSRYKTAVRKRRMSIHSKYKIVKSNNSKIRVMPSNKFAMIMNKYKIDRRTKEVRTKLLKKKVLKRSISDTLRYTLFKNVTWKKPAPKVDRFKVNHTNVIKQSKSPKAKPESNRFKRCLISLRGQKYVMDSQKKTLKLISSPANVNTSCTSRKISIKGVTYVQKSAFTYVKTNSSINSRISKNKSLRLQTNNLCKNNQPCPVYHRFGKCRRKDAGRCIFIHNPNQITVCKKFLQGACVDEACLLSHKISLEKMPTCKYFLEGCCVRTDCPYLHVKINPNAEICRNFLQGFCKDAMMCDKRHQYLCPDFEKYGKCPKRRCLYTHKSKSVKEICAKEKVIKNNKLENIIPVELPRYYDDAKTEVNDETKPKSTEAGDNEVSNNHVEFDCKGEFYKRPKLGILPSFIPFDK